MLFNHKKIILYLITNKVDIAKKDKLDDVLCYSITTTKQEAEECINRLLFIEHRQHFLAWCANKNITIANPYYPDQKIWELYYKLVWSDEPIPYIIQRVEYNLKSIASIFRMFNNTPPIGCSYETEMEIKRFSQDNINNCTNTIDSSQNRG
jgi:hypothetical protein